MQKVDISEWVRSALVIDDQWSEVRELIQLLNSNGVSTSYYNPNPKGDESHKKIDMTFLEKIPANIRNRVKRSIVKILQENQSYTRMKNLKDESITGYNLIFLDINFNDPAAPNYDSQVNFALDLLHRALSKDCTPYGLILWSKESAFETKDGSSVFEHIRSILFEGKVESLANMPKPLFIVDVDKAIHWGRRDYSKLIQTINEKLRKDTMARFFAYWNKEVLQSAASTCKTIQNYAEARFQVQSATPSPWVLASSKKTS